METNVICKQCLLRDMAESDILRSIAECRSRLETDMRVSDALYERRLAVCRSCERLNAGTCLLCGCYVELRAAMRKLDCPDSPSRWRKGAAYNEGGRAG